MVRTDVPSPLDGQVFEMRFYQLQFGVVGVALLNPIKEQFLEFRFSTVDNHLVFLLWGGIDLYPEGTLEIDGKIFTDVPGKFFRVRGNGMSFACFRIETEVLFEGSDIAVVLPYRINIKMVVAGKPGDWIPPVAFFAIPAIDAVK